MKPSNLLIRLYHILRYSEWKMMYINWNTSWVFVVNQRLYRFAVNTSLQYIHLRRTMRFIHIEFWKTIWKQYSLCIIVFLWFLRCKLYVYSFFLCVCYVDITCICRSYANKNLNLEDSRVCTCLLFDMITFTGTVYGDFAKLITREVLGSLDRFVINHTAPCASITALLPGT